MALTVRVIEIMSISRANERLAQLNRTLDEGHQWRRITDVRTLAVLPRATPDPVTGEVGPLAYLEVSSIVIPKTKD